MSKVLLKVDDVAKAFGASQALRGVSFELGEGEVHALVGENGAGKSTLMKVLSGAVRPDRGTITLDGKPYAPRSPRDARDQGVAMIYQELALAPHLSVEANVMLGRERTTAGLVRRARHRQIVSEALKVLDHPEIDPLQPVWTLNIGARQIVEVARALVSDARVVIFDEPTSSLSEQDCARLFAVIRRLSSAGISIIYISHILEDVQAIAQRYTVLRDGVTVNTGSLQDVALGDIIRMMVGRELSEVFPRIRREPGEPLLTLSAVRARHRFPLLVDLQLRKGEILGIAGLVGAGRTELLRAIFGLEHVVSGQVVVKGFGSGTSSPRTRIRQGLGFLSEDRKAEGLALGRSIEDNLTYPALDRHSSFGWLNLRKRRGAVQSLLGQVNVRCKSPAQEVVELSGGNQQKVALARLLHQRADVLLLDEPTRGIDVGSKAEVYRLLGELAAKGTAILMVSSYLPELFGVCDRLAVMSRGSLTEARPIAEWDQHSVMETATAT
ncbi:MAG: sugar ABC transporter ATP-binding protein [Isosphaeraceae bacterium]